MQELNTVISENLGIFLLKLEDEVTKGLIEYIRTE